MFLFGIILILLAFFILYKRITLILFGQKAIGYIVGYGNRTEGMKGIDTYNYRIKYEYEKRDYYACSLENVQVPRNGIPNKNLHRQVVVYFDKKNPSVVTIYDLKETTMLSIGMILSGLFLVLLLM